MNQKKMIEIESGVSETLKIQKKNEDFKVFVLFPKAKEYGVLCLGGRKEGGIK